MKNGISPRNYEAEDAARVLSRAEEIKQDKKLHKAAVNCLKKQQESISKAIKSKSTKKGK